MPTLAAVSAEDIRNIVAGLTAFPHRGSGTEHEREAAAFLRDYLTARGHPVETQPFLTSRTYSWELLGISALLAIGGLHPAAWVVLLGAHAGGGSRSLILCERRQ